MKFYKAFSHSITPILIILFFSCNYYKEFKRFLEVTEQNINKAEDKYILPKKPDIKSNSFRTYLDGNQEYNPSVITDTIPNISIMDTDIGWSRIGYHDSLIQLNNCEVFAKDPEMIWHEDDIPKEKFISCFINSCIERQDKIDISYDSIIDLIDRFEAEYNLHKKKPTDFVVIEDELFNTQYSIFNTYKSGQLRFYMNIPKQIVADLDSLEKFWKLGDTALFRKQYLNLYWNVEFALKGTLLNKREKLNLWIVYGYLSFVRYQDKQAMRELNENFVIADKFTKEEWHSIYHIIAKYNTTYFKQTGDYYYFKNAYYFYKKALECEMIKCYITNNGMCNAKEEFMRLPRMANKDLRIKRKSLEYVSNSCNFLKDRSKWLAIRAQFSEDFCRYYKFDYPIADSAMMYEVMFINSLLNTTNELSLRDSFLINCTKSFFLKDHGINKTAVNYAYLAHKQLTRLPYRDKTDLNYNSTIANIPSFLNGSGREIEAEKVYNYLLTKNFTRESSTTILQSMFYSYLELKKYKEANRINQRILDSAIRLKSNDLVYKHYMNCGIMAEKKNQKILSKLYFDLAKNYQNSQPFQNPYLAGETYLIDHKVDVEALNKQKSELEDKIAENNTTINNQTENIKILSLEKLKLNDNLENLSEQLILKKIGLDSLIKAIASLQSEYVHKKDSLGNAIINTSLALIDSTKRIGTLDSLNTKLANATKIAQDEEVNAKSNMRYAMMFAVLSGILTILMIRARSKARMEARINEYKSAIWQEFGHISRGVIRSSIGIIGSTTAKKESVEPILSNLADLLSEIFESLSSGTKKMGNKIINEIKLADLFVQHKNLVNNTKINVKFIEPAPEGVLPPAVLLSLVRNSMEGGKLISKGFGQINVNCKPVGNYLKWSVFDNGIGFPKHIKFVRDITEPKSTGLRNIEVIVKYFNKYQNKSHLTIGMGRLRNWLQNNLGSLKYNLRNSVIWPKNKEVININSPNEDKLTEVSFKLKT